MKRKKAYTRTADKEVSPPAKKTRECTSSPDIVCLSGPRPLLPEWYNTRCYNPLMIDVQQQLCRELGLQFVRSNVYTAGGPDVPLRPPTSVHRVPGDGNCLFRSLCYAITGSERQHFRLRRAIITHMRCTEACMSLLASHMGDDVVTIDEYIEHSRMDCNYSWGTHNEMLVLAHMAGLKMASYSVSIIIQG